jgi:hypothetical protein
MLCSGAAVYLQVVADSVNVLDTWRWPALAAKELVLAG